MNPVVLQIIAAGLSGLGFAVMFHIRPKYLPLILFGASLGWFIYLFSCRALESRTMPMIITAMAMTIYSEIFARVVHMPVPVIYTPIVIPLIPGSYLYYSMRGFITDSNADFVKYGGMLLEDALGLVLGSLLVLTLFSAAAAKHRKA